jgi:hypothetical protein
MGQCRLCRKLRPLKKSHFLSAGLWKGPRDPRLKNPNPVAMTRTVSKTSSKQMRALLLCEECEDRLNKNGERYVLDWLAPTQVINGGFPLLERMAVAIARSETPHLITYSGADIGIDTEKFAYFALSILWRASVHRWQLPDGSFASQILLDNHAEPIRRYLLTEVPFPNHVAVVLIVCSDRESRSCLFSPSLRGETPVRTYSFLALGVFFDILIGPNLPDDSRELLCCFNSKEKRIFRRDCSNRTFRAFTSLAATSRPTANLSHVKAFTPQD